MNPDHVCILLKKALIYDEYCAYFFCKPTFHSDTRSWNPRHHIWGLLTEECYQLIFSNSFYNEIVYY